MPPPTVKAATPTATPAASASAAPSATPSLAPSAEPSAVPSADVSAEPSADVSAEPSADASAEPSAEPSVEPSKEPSKVSEIRILNDVALTNEAGTEAYVYYDVFDQYGESMRTQTDIQWTTSPATKTVDKIAGKITIKKEIATPPAAQETFTYGQQIFVNGVHVKTGTVKQASLTIGMAQAVDSVKFGGFIDTNDPTKILESLPQNFAVDRYYLLFQTFDQNGNQLDVTDSEEYASKNLTFVCDNPLLLALENTTAYKTFTVADNSYAAVQVQPKQYVDKGGEANITVIANKTGSKTNINVVVGKMAQLKSLELLTPSSVVADGDQWVEIPYKALDAEGNTITNYETIVRSSNTLTLSAGDGSELVVKEKNDGTAGVYWSDSSDYDVTDAGKKGTYSKSAVSDGIDRQVALTTVVVGGESNNTMLSVSDIRIPTTIVGVKDDALKDYMANGNSVKIGVTDENILIFKDQYGKEMTPAPNTNVNAQANAFFTYAGSNFFGNSSDGGFYGVKVVGNNEFGVKKAPVILKAGDSQTITASLDLDETVDGDDKDGNKTNDYVIDVNETTVKFTIAKSKTSDAAAADWNDNSKVFSKTIYAVPIAKLSNLRISGLDDVAYYNTAKEDLDNTGKTKSDDLNAGSITALKNKSASIGSGKYNVYGSYKGNDIEVQPGNGWITKGTGSDFAIADKYEEYQSYLTLGDLDTSSSTPTDEVGYVTYGDLYDYGTYGDPAKKANFEAVINIVNENSDDVAAAKAVMTEAMAAEDTKIKAAITEYKAAITDKDEKIAAVGTEFAALEAKTQALQTHTETEAAWNAAKALIGTDGTKLDYLTDAKVTAAKEALDAIVTAMSENSANSTSDADKETAVSTGVTATKTKIDAAVQAAKVADINVDWIYSMVNYEDGAKIYGNDAMTWVENALKAVKDYDTENTAKDTAIDKVIAAIKAAKTVYDTQSAAVAAVIAELGSGTTTLTKDVTICVAKPSITTIASTDGTLIPTNTSTDGSAAAANIGNYDGWVSHSTTTGPAVYCGNGWAHSGLPTVSTVDQYGRGLDGTIIYTISDIKEAENEFAHVSGNATVQDNGTESAYVKGAEIGDTFKVTAKVKGTTLSTSFTVTIGADSLAQISSKTANSTDEVFRKNALGFVK